MNQKMYTINSVAQLSHISVRTLRHYDEIALLKPLARNNSGHRIYGERELLRLQQILFYKELDFSLEEIKKILDDKSFDLVSALEAHKSSLSKRQVQISSLIRTIDKTILYVKSKQSMTDEELYEGFSKEEIVNMNTEVDKTYNLILVAQSRGNAKNMSKSQWSKLKQEGGDIMLGLIELMDTTDVSDPRIQKLVERQYALIGNFFTPTVEIFRVIGRGYIEDERFKRFYDKHKEGLAAYFQKAIDYYCNLKLEKAS